MTRIEGEWCRALSLPFLTTPLPLYRYIVMFASVAPWATFVCLLINLVERRADAARMLYAQQRPRYN